MDTPLSRIGPLAESLKFIVTLVVQVRVSPSAVVEHRDVFDNVSPCIFASLVAAPVDSLGHQGAEEALDDRIVPAVSLRFSDSHPGEPRLSIDFDLCSFD